MQRAHRQPADASRAWIKRNQRVFRARYRTQEKREPRHYWRSNLRETMVNLTESFTKLYGRPPTESEVAAMWQMKREQEGYKKTKNMSASQVAPQKRKQEPRTPKMVARNYNYRWPHRASQIAQRINRMLHIQMTIKDIAFVEGATENLITAEINKWTLPRENTEVYKKFEKP
jgi:hypothetical protein